MTAATMTAAIDCRNASESFSLLDGVLAATEEILAARDSEPESPVAFSIDASPAVAVATQVRGGQVNRRSSSGRQKLRTVGIGPSRYGFGYKGRRCEVGAEGARWYLLIDGVRSKRSFKTKRHAVNYSRVVIDSNRDKTGPQPQAKQTAAAPAKSATAVQVQLPPAPSQTQSSAPAKGWRALPQTRRQSWMIGHLVTRGARIPVGVAAEKLNRGQTSDLIDAMKRQISDKTKTDVKSGIETEGCSIGPFKRGVCTCCGLRKSK